MYEPLIEEAARQKADLIVLGETLTKVRNNLTYVDCAESIPGPSTRYFGELARKHYQVEAGLTHVIRINGSAEVEFRPDEPIKLLEVNENTVPSGIMPIQFGPSPASGLHYSTIILEVTPDEFEQIRNNELRLPNGWTIGEPIPRTAAEQVR